jgi:hypothetical protein
MYQSSNSGSSWSENAVRDGWFKTKAGAVEKDTYTFVHGGNSLTFVQTNWLAQTFTAGSDYTITSVVLNLTRWAGFAAPGTITVSIKATDSGAPGKAQTPTPTDDQGSIRITGTNRITKLQWEPPDGETPQYKVYFRAQGGSWVLQETTNDTEHAISTTVLDSLGYYSIYEWRVDTVANEVTTTGDTWTFITLRSLHWTDHTRRSDYNADKVWQPGTGWVDPNTFEFAGGGQYKGRLVVVGHNVIYFGDI